MVEAPQATSARFKVVLAEPNGDAEVHVTMQPDYTDDSNKAWAPHTPSGLIKLVVVPSLAADFPLGRNFTVLFTPDPLPVD